MRDVCVIMGMDWLSRFGAMIDCEHQLVTYETLVGKSVQYTTRLPDLSRHFVRPLEQDIVYSRVVWDFWHM